MYFIYINSLFWIFYIINLLASLKELKAISLLLNNKLYFKFIIIVKCTFNKAISFK